MHICLHCTYVHTVVCMYMYISTYYICVCVHCAHDHSHPLKDFDMINPTNFGKPKRHRIMMVVAIPD